MVAYSVHIDSLLQEPQTIGETELERLHHLSAQMPWCSAYHILLARGYSNEDSFLQKKYLRQAASYSGDRQVLFDFLTEEREESPAVLASKGVELPIQKEEPEPVDEVYDTPTHSEEIKVRSEETEIIQDGIHESKNREVSLPVETNSELDSSNQEEEKIDFEKLVVYNPLKELEKQIPEKSDSIKESIPLDYVVYDPERELSKIAEEKESEEEHDFLFWLNNSKEESEPTPRESKSVDHIQDLLDQFLATKRSRPISKRDFYKAESKAEESEKDNMDVISETLLELYVKQGHFSKAIQGYEKLSLQNPEKTAYFVARIKEIQQF